MKDFSKAADKGYKMRVNGHGGRAKWSPVLSFVKKDDGQKLLFFKPHEDTESTAKTLVVHLYVAWYAQAAEVKEFDMCKFYGEWEPAPHACGKDCPLGK